MALASAPYKWKITARTLIVAGTWALDITITDNAGATRKTTTIHVGIGESYSDIVARVQDQVGIAMGQDAGGKAQLIDALIAAGTLFNA